MGRSTVSRGEHSLQRQISTGNSQGIRHAAVGVQHRCRLFEDTRPSLLLLLFADLLLFSYLLFDEDLQVFEMVPDCRFTLMGLDIKVGKALRDVLIFTVYDDGLPLQLCDMT